VSVCPSVRRRFRVLIDAAESARTVGQFCILMDQRNRAGQIVRPGRRNSQGEETDKSFGLADGIFKAKRRTDCSAWQTEFSRWREEAHPLYKDNIKTTCLSVRPSVITFFYLLLPNLPKLLSTGRGGPARAGEWREGVFFFFSFFLGPPSFSCGWLEWRSHGLPTPYGWREECEPRKMQYNGETYKKWELYRKHKPHVRNVKLTFDT